MTIHFRTIYSDARVSDIRSRIYSRVRQKRIWTVDGGVFRTETTDCRKEFVWKTKTTRPQQPREMRPNFTVNSSNSEARRVHTLLSERYHFKNGSAFNSEIKITFLNVNALRRKFRILPTNNNIANNNTFALTLKTFIATLNNKECLTFKQSTRQWWWWWSGTVTHFFLATFLITDYRNQTS